MMTYHSKIEKDKVKIKTLPAESASSSIDIRKNEFDEGTEILKILLADIMEKHKNYEIEIEFPETPFRFLSRYRLKYYSQDK